MTLAELHERIGWQLEGKLQLRITIRATWRDARNGTCDVPRIDDHPDLYRRRPDQQPMPDEIWIPQCDGPGLALDGQWYTNHMRCEKFGRPTRYIRADGVFGGERLQWRIQGVEMEWNDKSNSGLEYRLKP